MIRMTLQVIFLLAGLTTLISSCNGQSPKKSNTATGNAATCSHCGKGSCDKNCSTAPKTKDDSSSLKVSLPSCNLSGDEMIERKKFLQSTMAKKITRVVEMETGYDLIFTEPKEYAFELLEFINFERSCCSSFSYALIFEPNNKATHLQIYGTKDIKNELAKGFKELGLLK